MFSQLFSCCVQRKPSNNFKTPNEQSRLIPPTEEPTPNDELLIDHQKFKERMSSIVRSKEGKMVNVNARLPFNLHNKNLSATMGASSSGSRSASGSSTNRPSLNFSPLSPSSQSHEHIQGYVGAPLTPVTHPVISRDSSLSREPSAHESETSTPILNLRLVKSLPSASIGIAARRGRARKKYGENNASATVIQQESLPADSGLPASDGTVADHTPRGEDFPLHAAETIEPKPTLSISPASTVDFILQDTGPLTASWGD
ncbi:hypothetical protein BYT27DRAFT_6960675 [Phlegmacium glaucopus]|nr:hypothetical protein BYT27DRAFT_6960675 [Phlegmacium glaucopus]